MKTWTGRGVGAGTEMGVRGGRFRQAGANDHIEAAGRCQALAAEYEEMAQFLRDFGDMLLTRAGDMQDGQPARAIAPVGRAVG